MKHHDNDNTFIALSDEEVPDYEKENDFFPVQENIKFNLTTNKKILNWIAEKSENNYQNASKW